MLLKFGSQEDMPKNNLSKCEYLTNCTTYAWKQETVYVR